MRKRTLFAAVATLGLLAGGAAFAHGPGWGQGGGYGHGHGHGHGGQHGMMGQGMMGQGMMGQGMMGQGMMGQGMMGQGMPCREARGGAAEMTPETVTQHLQQHLERRGNDRLALGEVAEAEDGTITADIVTKAEGALVERFAFDPDTGRMRRLP